MNITYLQRQLNEKQQTKGNKEKIFGDGYIMSYTRQTSEENGDRIILNKMITIKKMEMMIRKNDYIMILQQLSWFYN